MKNQGMGVLVPPFLQHRGGQGKEEPAQPLAGSSDSQGNDLSEHG